MDLALPPTVTDRAYARLAEINENVEASQALRIAVEGGGCSGFQYEIKLEKSVKVILGAFAFGIILNAFVTPIGQELFGIKDANAAGQTNKIAICNESGTTCANVDHRGLWLYN